MWTSPRKHLPRKISIRYKIAGDVRDGPRQMHIGNLKVCLVLVADGLLQPEVVSFYFNFYHVFQSFLYSSYAE